MRIFLSLILAAFAGNWLVAQTQLDEGTVLLEINFELDRHQMRPDQKKKVDSLLDVTPLPIIKTVEIYGHTDSLADEDYNRQLSRQRVQSLLQYLVYRGLDPLKVETDHFGEERPQYDNGPDERHKNRRCEMVFRIDPALLPESDARLSDFEFKKGESIRIPNLQFVGNQPIPVSGSYDALKDLLFVMKTQPDLKIELHGHVCCHDNLELSQERSKMIYAFLLGNGISSDRMSYKGFSNRKPIYPEKNDEEKAMNRRVEIYVKSNSDQRTTLEEDKVKMDLRAPLLDVKFFPKKQRLYPSGHFMLTLLAEMMREPSDLSYEFVVFDNINDSRLTSGRAAMIERTLTGLKVDRSSFTVHTQRPSRQMAFNEDMNLMMVKITEQK